jgi:poly(beta-D-mannuronate) lyase
MKFVAACSIIKKPRLHRLLALTVGVVLLTPAALALDRLVATASQFTTALAASQPGDTITLTNRVWQNVDLLFKKNGAAANPITLRAQSPGGVIISGDSRLRIAGNWLVVDGLRFQNGTSTSTTIEFRESSSSLATNCAVRNTAIVDNNKPGDTTDTKWVSLYGLSNRVEYCYFKGKTNSGTTLVVWLASGQTNFSNCHIIRRNYFGPRPNLGVNGGETIRVGDSSTSFTSSRTLVEENLFYKCNGETEIISSKSLDNTYRYNTFDSCEGALTLRHGNSCTVEGNWFLGRGLPLTGGVRVIGEDHRVYNNYFADLMGTGYRSALTFMMGVPDSALNEYFQVKRATVAFNTFINCQVSILIGLVGSTVNSTLPPLDCVIANNIVHSAYAPLIQQSTTPVNMTWDGNIMFGASLGIAGNSGITVTDPKLTLLPDGFWRPATNSPALGTAVGSYAFLTNDFDGQLRPAAKDVGCDQFSAAPVVRRPLGPTDVGPLWMRSVGPIQAINYLSNAVTLTWASVPGIPYRVQYSSNAVNWLPVSQTVSNQLTKSTWTDDGSLTGGPPGNGATRFYRIVLTP